MDVALIVLPLLAVAVYAWLMILFTRAWKKTPDWRTGQGRNRVTLSIIIPYRNESGNIEACLRSLKNQETVTHDFEIICIDDHSTDGSRNAVAEFSASWAKVRNEFLDHAEGKKMALAHGIGKSTGNWIATLDADVVVEKKWLTTLTDFLSSTNASMVIMPVMFNCDGTFFGNFQVVELLALQGVAASSAFLGKPLMCNGANLAFRRDVYNRVNGMMGRENISSGDDMFLLEKFQSELPGSISWLKSHDTIAWTDASRTFSDLISQRVRWASKMKAYRNFNIVAVAAITWLANASLAVLFVASCCNIGWLAYFVLLLLLKSNFDIILVKPVAGWFGAGRALVVFPILVFVNVFYSVFIPVIGFFYRPKWKGRTITISQ